METTNLFKILGKRIVTYWTMVRSYHKGTNGAPQSSQQRSPAGLWPSLSTCKAWRKRTIHSWPATRLLRARRDPRRSHGPRPIAAVKFPPNPPGSQSKRAKFGGEGADPNATLYIHFCDDYGANETASVTRFTRARAWVCFTRELAQLLGRVALRWIFRKFVVPNLVEPSPLSA